LPSPQTHSLEVAQVAKAIALHINATVDEFKAFPIDTDLVEVAALAHDLGHPPFGHNGEAALDACMKKRGGFEGNAQTLRLLARIEKKVFRGEDPDDAESYCGIGRDGTDYRAGLNLTFRSLASVLKYDSQIPLVRQPDEKLAKGYYVSEAPLVAEIKRNVGQPPDKAQFKTIECQIMDIADDIAYST
jgi:dGTPase